MRTALAWTLIIPLLLLPLALGQGPPGGTPSPSPTPTPNQTSPTPSPGATPPQGNGRDGPPDDRVPDDRPAGPPVMVEDAADGFGARPTDPASTRPVFAFDAARGLLTAERAGAPPIRGLFDALMEFIDEDGDGAYGVGEPVLQRHALVDLDLEIRAPSATVREAVYTIPDGGTLVLRFHLDPAGDGQAAKFDVLIEGFPFTHPESRLALGVRVAADDGLRLGEVERVPAVVALGAGQRPYLSWVATAEAGNASVPVVASVHVGAGQDDAVVYWGYPQAAILLHDPVLGYAFFPLDRLGDPAVFAASLAAGVALLWIGFETRRRFRP